MQGFNNQTNRSKFGKYRTLIVSLAVVLIGAGVFAATGGVQKFRGILVTVDLTGDDGTQQARVVLESVGDQPIELHLGESGEGSVIFESDDAGDGESVIEIQFVVDGDALEVQTLTATIGDAETVEVVLTTNDDEGDTTGRTRLRELGMTKSGFDLNRIMAESLNTKGLAERIDAAEMLETWTTDDGRTRELYVLPALDGVVGSESGLQVVIVTEDANGERTAQLAGSITGVDPGTTELTDLSWNNGSAAALSFTKEDGGELTIDILTSDEALDGNGKAHIALCDDGTMRRTESPKTGRTRD